MTLGIDPALARLLVLKLRGRGRAALRRLKTPKGCVFGLVGAALFVLWVAALAVRLTGGGRTASAAGLPHGDAVALAQLAIGLYALFAVTANLSWRGLYLPRAEVERLFAAPVSRRALVRYRLLGMAVPSTFVAVLVGVMAAARVPAPWAGFCGGVLVVATATVLGQGAALLAAHEGGWFGRLVQRVPGGLPRLVGALGLAGVLLLLMFGADLLPRRGGELLRNGEVVDLDLELALRRGGGGALGVGLDELAVRSTDHTLGRLAQVARHPATRVLSAPAYPLAAAVVAPTFLAAVPWLALSMLIVLLGFELVARLPVDYREASLSTSRDVERRLARLRRGQFGAAAGDGRTLVGWRVPWVFGTSPFGAVLWLKTATILRQGRGTLAVASITTAIGVLVGVTLLPERGVGTASLVVMGVAYLASGLRFDFRAELDRMQSLRAWPLAAWQVFVAVVLPVTLLVSCFVCIVLGVRGIVLDDLSLEVLGAMCATPLVAFLWIALDNAVFLLFPVRFVPGMGGALQHSGRALLMVLLRLVLLGVAGTAAAGVGIVASSAATWLGLGPAVVVGAMASAAVSTLLGFAALLAAVGGQALGRFDPAEASLAGG